MIKKSLKRNITANFLKLYVFMIFNAAFYCNAQGPVKTSYLGQVNAKGIGSMPYVLNMMAYTNDSISGYTITDPQGPAEIKTTIEGRIMHSPDRLTFTEKRVVYSKVKLGTEDVCFIQATLYKGNSKGKNESYKGHFVGINPNARVKMCASGSIRLFNTNKLLAALTKIAPPRDSISAKPIANKVGNIILNHKSNLAFITKESSVNLNIWDSGVIDGDMVRIEVNGVLVADSITLAAVSKTVRIQLRNDLKTIVMIKSLSTGSQGLNTAMLTIGDSHSKLSAICNLKVGEYALVTINDISR